MPNAREGHARNRPGGEEISTTALTGPFAWVSHVAILNDSPCKLRWYRDLAASLLR
jgi:hypothetical protein